MKCAWQAFLNLLPPHMRNFVDEQGREQLLELRLRAGYPPELICIHNTKQLQMIVRTEDLQYVTNAACRYSPWTADSIARGYLTAQGGHRIGLCGEAAVQEGKMVHIRAATSLCMRVARDFPNIGKTAPQKGSILILGRPGSGKTTLLRDLIRLRSENGEGSVAVVDERGELFPTHNGQNCFPIGCRTDVLTGCPKKQGISLLLRTMGPATIAVDEISDNEDCQALLNAVWCGVDLMATAHAESVRDYLSRPIYKSLVDTQIFKSVLVMQRDKTWKEERIHI